MKLDVSGGIKGDRWALGSKWSEGMVDGFSISLGDDALVSILLGMLALARPSQKAHVLHSYAPGLLAFLYLFLPSLFFLRLNVFRHFNITRLQCECYRTHCVHLTGFRATEGGRSLFQVVPNSGSGLEPKPRRFCASPAPMILCTTQASPHRMNWLHQT